ncbi:MAG: glycosyltransferase family 4 protein [Acidimicrobiales bacterium]
MVQQQAVELLPSSVTAIERGDSHGLRRALQGLRPVPDVDLLHGLDVDLPLVANCPTVSTVHDLSVFDTPWAFSRYRSAGERRLLSRSIRKADELIAVSAFTAERIDHHFARSATVIPLAPRSNQTPIEPGAVDAVRRKHQLPERFVLQLASIEPRKDVELLADACAKLDIPLVLAGGHNRRSKVPSTAHHLGYVDDTEVDALLDAADIVAYISRYEGFGLPPLEAMARGRAVVASAVGALPEVAADGAELVPVGAGPELQRILEDLWNDCDRRHELATRGQQQAAALTWNKTAAATLDVYRKLGLRL